MTQPDQQQRVEAILLDYGSNFAVPSITAQDGLREATTAITALIDEAQLNLVNRILDKSLRGTGPNQWAALADALSWEKAQLTKQSEGDG